MDFLGYKVGTRVRLRWSFGDVASGSEGVVIGFYREDSPAYAVVIGKTSVKIPPEYVEAIDVQES